MDLNTRLTCLRIMFGFILLWQADKQLRNEQMKKNVFHFFSTLKKDLLHGVVIRDWEEAQTQPQN